MEHIAVSIVSWLAGVLLGQYGRDLGLILTGWFNRDIPSLHGQWLAYGIRTANVGFSGFTDLGNYLSADDGPEVWAEKAGFRERVTVTQIGRLVFGEISSMDAARVYKFRGRIVRNAVIATFHLVGRTRPAGSGSFQLIANPEDQALIGKSVWHDNEEDKILSADYGWFRSDHRWEIQRAIAIKGEHYAQFSKKIGIPRSSNPGNR
jgi:hypothetical protein